LSEFLDSLPSVAHQVFLYQIIKFSNRFDDYITLNDETGVSVATTELNHASNISGYTLSNELYDTVILYTTTFKDTIKLCDLGVNILLLNFSKYFANSQYHLFVNEFDQIRELEDFEKKLLKCSNTFLKVPKNLAIDSKYGIRAQSKNFVNKNSMPIESFNSLFSYMSSKVFVIERFIDMLKPYHINIIESIYSLVSLTRQTRVILECRDLNSPNFTYTISRILKSNIYTGCMWFVLPESPVWFAYSKGNIKKTSYITRSDETAIVRLFEKESDIIVGIICNNTIYPLYIDGSIFHGSWLMTYDYFKNKKFNILYNLGPPRGSNIHFVNNNQCNIYKLVIYLIVCYFIFLTTIHQCHYNNYRFLLLYRQRR